MAEYINRDELIENLKNFAPENYTDLIHQLITKQPAADVVEVKHGEWIRPTTIHGMTIPGLPHCSVCGEIPCDEGKYCPNCGAKTDGEKELKK